MIKPVKTGLFSSAIFLLLFFSISCKKPVSDEVPILKTASVTVLSASSVKCGGQITSEGSASVAARGVCWSLTKNPSVLNSDSMTVDGNGIGVFSSTIPGLKPGIS